MPVSAYLLSSLFFIFSIHILCSQGFNDDVRPLRPLHRTPKTCNDFSFDIEYHPIPEFHERHDLNCFYLFIFSEMSAVLLFVAFSG